MHDERPDDWQQAVAVDNAVRDWRQIGVNDEVYVSKSLLPLEKVSAIHSLENTPNHTVGSSGEVHSTRCFRCAGMLM